jgi:hypothetical protein
MADGPKVWNIGESIPVDLDIEDPNTGLGLTGQTAYLTLTIQRFSDGYYWSDALTAWASTPAILSFVETDPINQPGRYLYTLPAVANFEADKYEAHANINNPTVITADTYELHVSRDLTLNVYNITAA